MFTFHNKTSAFSVIVVECNHGCDVALFISIDLRINHDEIHF